MSKYLDFHAHLSHDPQAQQFFEEQTKLLKDRLETSDNKLRDFQLKTGIGNLEQQKSTLIARISELQNEAAKTGAQVSGSEQQIAALGSELKSTPERIQKESRSEQNMALQQLKPEVMQLRAEKEECSRVISPIVNASSRSTPSCIPRRRFSIERTIWKSTSRPLT